MSGSYLHFQDPSSNRCTIVGGYQKPCCCCIPKRFSTCHLFLNMQFLSLNFRHGSRQLCLSSLTRVDLAPNAFMSPKKFSMVANSISRASPSSSLTLLQKVVPRTRLS